jgi:hypothetical protein
MNVSMVCDPLDPLAGVIADILRRLQPGGRAALDVRRALSDDPGIQ